MANLLFATRESDSLRSENPRMSQPSRGLVLVESARFPPDTSTKKAARARARVNPCDMAQSPLWVAGLRWLGAAVASPDRTVSGDQGRIDDSEGFAALDEVDRRHAQVLPQLAR